MGKFKEFTQEQRKEICRLYIEERKGLQNIGNLFNSAQSTIKRILTEEGITLRSHRESKKKYEYDETYFSQINTPDKAYWLGFIYADGFICKAENGNPILGITLAEPEPIEKIKIALKSNLPIRSYKKVNGYSDKSIEYKIAFHSKQMVEDLEKWGCVERKTFKLKFPDFLSEELIPHFIRGYFDGDGSVYLHINKANNKEYVSLGAQFAGIHDFLFDMRQHFTFLNKEDKCLYQDTRKETDCWRIQLNSIIRALKLYHYMYKNCPQEICLSRKREKFENFIKDRGSETTITNPIYGDAEYKSLCYIED